jgi:hypothetical protein
VGALRPGGPTDRSQFVLASTPERFAERARDELEGLSDGHLEAIRRIQPFAGEPWGHIGRRLTTIHDLARVDRHRAPLLQVAILAPRYAEGRDHRMAIEHRRSLRDHEYEPGRMLAVHYDVEVQIAEPIAGAQGHEITGLLESFGRELGWIVDALQRGVFLEMMGGAPERSGP